MVSFPDPDLYRLHGHAGWHRRGGSVDHQACLAPPRAYMGREKQSGKD